MSGPRVFFCRTCERADATVPGQVRAALKDAGIPAHVHDGACMSGCARGPALAVRASGKMAYLFGEFEAGDIADLIVFLRLYEQSSDGDLADARPIGSLRTKALARIPAVSK